MSRVCELSGKSVMTGNNVSKANNRTRRRFLPNLQKSSMHSSILGKTLQFRVAASTIRTVEKNGGIDSYLLKSSKTSLPLKAKKLRQEIIKAKDNTQ
jgi:large subunit ribosomal protein L28